MLATLEQDVIRKVVVFFSSARQGRHLLRLRHPQDYLGQMDLLFVLDPLTLSQALLAPPPKNQVLVLFLGLVEFEQVVLAP